MILRDIKSILLNICFVLCVFTVVHAQPSETVIQKIQQSFSDKNAEVLKGALSNSFSIAGNTQEGAIKYLEQLVVRYPFKQITLLQELKQGNNIRVDFKIERSDDLIDTSFLMINQEGQLLFVDLFDRLYGMRRVTNPKLRARIPFKNKNGSIILQVRINDYKPYLNLLFDSGADGMAVRKSLADSIGLQVTRENNASVVGGQMNIQVSDQNTIYLDTLKLLRQGIAIFPTMSDDTDGIIGNSLLRHFITHIDYDNNEMLLYDFGEHAYSGNGTIVPVDMPAGLLILQGDLELVQGKKHTGQFVFDTGAAYDLICFRAFVRQHRLLVSGFKPETQSATVSMGMTSPTFIGRSYGFSLTPLSPFSDFPVTLMGGTASNETWTPGFDGSVGVRLLSRYNMTINLANNEIFFAPNKLHGLPYDFLLKDYLLGWDNSGTLRILEHITQGEKDDHIIGKEVISIGKNRVKELIKKPSLILDLKEQAKTINMTILLENQESITI